MRTESLKPIDALHAGVNPASLFASVQETSAPDAADLAALIDKAENEQLIWLTRKDDVLVEMRELLAKIDSSKVRKAAIAT